MDEDENTIWIKTERDGKRRKETERDGKRRKETESTRFRRAVLRMASNIRPPIDWMKKWTFLTIAILMVNPLTGAALQRASVAPLSLKFSPAAKHEPKRPERIRRRKRMTLKKQAKYQDVAWKYGMTVQELNELNKLDLKPNTLLAKGSELYVYVRF